MKNLLRDTSASFYTTGDGLRGVPVLCMDRDDGSLYSARVYSNTADRLWLDTPLTKEPDQYDAYILGSVPTAIESGDITFGNPRTKKSLKYITVEYERGHKGHLDWYLATDQTDVEKTAWRYIGAVSLTGLGTARLPVDNLAGTGYVFRYIIMGTDPSHLWAITHMSIEFETDADFAKQPLG